MTSGTEISNKNAEQVIPWHVQFLEATDDAEEARLLKKLNSSCSGDRAVLDVVERFQSMTRREILDSYADPADLKQAEAITGLRELRWHRIKQAVRVLRPEEGTLAPETQLAELRRCPKKENLLDFVLRYRRTADAFIREGVMTKARCMQILYQKLPVDLQKSMWTMPFRTASLDLIEDVVRNRLNWLAIVATEMYTAEELSQYLAMDAMDPSTFKGGNADSPPMRKSVVVDGEIQYSAIGDADDLMTAFKKLMEQPCYRRQAEKLLDIRRVIRHSDSATTLCGKEGERRVFERDSPSPKSPPSPPAFKPPMLTRPAVMRSSGSRRYVL